jgi:hypothetical protein
VTPSTAAAAVSRSAIDPRITSNRSDGSSTRWWHRARTLQWLYAGSARRRRMKVWPTLPVAPVTKIMDEESVVILAPWVSGYDLRSALLCPIDYKIWPGKVSAARSNYHQERR